MISKGINMKAKTKVKKTISNIVVDDEDEQKKLAGPREAVALEVLHMMFLKEVAKSSNFVAFQKRKNVVEKKSLQQGVDIAMKKCVEGEDSHAEDSETDSGLSDA